MPITPDTPIRFLPGVGPGRARVLDENALRSMRWLILVLLPLIPAILGVGVWWYRRA